MKTIKLQSVPITPGILSFLERRKLILRLKAPKAVLDSRKPGGAMQTLYCSASCFGAHKLICVKKNSSGIKLTYHPDNEEFLLLNNSGRKFRPLYMVIGLDKYQGLRKKMKKRSLGPADFIALEMRYNHPQTSVFTMLKNTPHCELSAEGKDNGPVFFVAEPSRLKMRSARFNGYKFILQSASVKAKRSKPGKK
jgi:hypothetical protein